VHKNTIFDHYTKEKKKKKRKKKKRERERESERLAFVVCLIKDAPNEINLSKASTKYSFDTTSGLELKCAGGVEIWLKCQELFLHNKPPSILVQVKVFYYSVNKKKNKKNCGAVPFCKIVSEVFLSQRL
jgi:hypothetical protein